MFAWHALWLIHSDSFLFLLHVERNRNVVPCWKTLFTNVASACPVWSSRLFLLHYMAGNRSWLGLAHVFPPPWRQPSSIILTLALYSHSAASLLVRPAAFHANVCELCRISSTWTLNNISIHLFLLLYITLLHWSFDITLRLWFN